MVIAAVTLAGCDGDRPPAGTPNDAPPPAPSAWSREALGSADDAAAPPAPSGPSAIALAEILRAVPASTSDPTAPDGGRVGTDTGEPAPDAGPVDGGVPHGHAAPARPFVAMGEAAEQPPLSSPGIERALRAELYWPLVQRCRDPSGAILPPDAVTLEFRIEADGRIAPSSIVSKAAQPEFEDAADCMRRELASAGFSGPEAAHGVTTLVTATVPSVD